MSTDVEWEKWGAQDPYFGVLTNSKFRAAEMTPEAREEFFAHGRWHAEYVMGICRSHLDSTFSPTRVLDFGCGVGRVLIPFAAIAKEVVGVDVSKSMLLEAKRNCDLYGAGNVELAMSDDALSMVEGTFDLIHSWTVLQHIGQARGLRLFEQLFNRLAPNGIGGIHVTFAWDIYRESFGIEPPPRPEPKEKWHKNVRRAVAQLIRMPLSAPVQPLPELRDPEMQMNFYNLSQFVFLLQRAGISQVHLELTDHGGALGAFMFFRRSIQ